jgi:hypothetical protein
MVKLPLAIGLTSASLNGTFSQVPTKAFWFGAEAAVLLAEKEANVKVRVIMLITIAISLLFIGSFLWFDTVGFLKIKSPA